MMQSSKHLKIVCILLSKMNDGKTSGQEVGGYAKGTTAKDINFMIIPKPGAIAVF